MTSLLNRTRVTEYGVEVDPTLTFDERGHRRNTVIYGAYACDENSLPPERFIPTVEEFIGEGGSFTAPHSIGTVFPYSAGYQVSGKESIAAMQFANKTLNPGESCSYLLVLSVSEKGKSNAIGYLSLERFQSEFSDNKKYWKSFDFVGVHTAYSRFDSWMKWVSVQPVLRRIYGCSFLPHHDYGRGGRGWRDLWQDCLALLLNKPEQVKPLLLNNFAGVRIDGTNATIIGEKPGEFVADRNNIVRVWMDHGAWSTVTVKLYVEQTGDSDILLEEQSYFKDRISFRGESKDTLWNQQQGNRLLENDGEIYLGTVLEHLLVQNLTVFFRVGEHNIMRLDGADWNDGLDMASERGESVAFTCLYYKNLLDIAGFINSLGKKDIKIAKELFILLDSKEADYDSVAYKTEILNQYCKAVEHSVSGVKLSVSAEDLIADILKKAEHIKNTVNQNEIVTFNDKKWYNSYYDNSGEKVEGAVNGNVRMMLTGQVFAVMSGIASDLMIENIVKAADEYLFDLSAGGYRLNTDFGEIKTDLGRLFGFAYGTKENGAVFSHMAVMYANALYSRGFVKEGYKVLNTLFKSADNFEKSHIYPGIPEYFEQNGRGMYHYLTGAASWYMITVICEMFGVKGKDGLLTFTPKLVLEQFDADATASITLPFYGKQFNVKYINSGRLDYGEYRILSISLNGDVLKELSPVLPPEKCDDKNDVLITLGKK